MRIFLVNCFQFVANLAMKVEMLLSQMNWRTKTYRRYDLLGTNWFLGLVVLVGKCPRAQCPWCFATVWPETFASRWHFLCSRAAAAAYRHSFHSSLSDGFRWNQLGARNRFDCRYRRGVSEAVVPKRLSPIRCMLMWRSADPMLPISCRFWNHFWAGLRLAWSIALGPECSLYPGKCCIQITGN